MQIRSPSPRWSGCDRLDDVSSEDNTPKVPRQHLRSPFRKSFKMKLQTGKCPALKMSPLKLLIGVDEGVIAIKRLWIELKRTVYDLEDAEHLLLFKAQGHKFN
ncbi:hypothetical protein RF11_00449 [Thelohanellus kitauei]|uniref:Uncharacterized protein n=1 Tax=Thelohanellus kitauei TaxID=669202 RepID=A0A0C2INM8_THEKT|nr:hypothetical protein RF11_00449 [Thelohanellus kitauei]